MDFLLRSVESYGRVLIGELYMYVLHRSQIFVTEENIKLKGKSYISHLEMISKLDLTFNLFCNLLFCT